MDREIIPVEIEKHTFEVKSYATALESNAIKQAYFNGTKLEVVGDQPKISEFNPNVQFEVQQEMIKQMVVKMDGSEERIVERCLELPVEEFDTLTGKLDDIITKKKS